MSIQKKHLINKKYQHHKTILDNKIQFSINNKICSKDISDIYFTNFIKKDKVRYPFIRKQLIQIKNNIVEFDNYEIKEENYSKKNRSRMNIIYEKTYNNKNSKTLIRIKHIYNKEFQLFCYDNNGNFEIQLIDIFHLIIPAADKEHGEKVSNIENKYFLEKGGTVDLKNLI